MIEVDNISFAYEKNKYIYENLSFKINKGDLVLILGQNGSGKSTLLKCLCGINKPTKGQVLLDGQNLNNISFKDRAKYFSYLSQEGLGKADIRVLDLVMMGRTPHKGYFSYPGREDKKIAKEKLRQLSIMDLEDKSFSDLSGGQQQLVMIAASLSQEADLLVFDEPTAPLDFKSQYSFLKTIKELNEAGKTIILTSHNPDHALALEARTLMIKDGHILLDGPAESVITEASMEKLYGVKTSLFVHQGQKRILSNFKNY